MSPTRRTLLLTPFAATLAGCAATVSRDAGAPSGAPAGAPVAAALARPSDAAARRIALALTRTNTQQSADDWAALRDEWKTSMTAAAAAAGASFVLLDEGSTAFTGPGVLLRARVNDFRYVSQAKRYLLGVFTGNASLDVDVEFVEVPAGRVLGTRKYATSSSAMQGIFSAMTPKQVEAVSKEMVTEVTRR